MSVEYRGFFDSDPRKNSYKRDVNGQTHKPGGRGVRTVSRGRDKEVHGTDDHARHAILELQRGGRVLSATTLSAVS